jgi:hypothetical protein
MFMGDKAISRRRRGDDGIRPGFSAHPGKCSGILCWQVRQWLIAKDEMGKALYTKPIYGTSTGLADQTFGRFFPSSSLVTASGSNLESRFI